jgi:acid phosphatase
MLSVLKMAPWFQELRAHIRASLSGVSSTRYFHKYVHSRRRGIDVSFAHDGSTAAVLGILQAHYPIWPGMASEIVFELWQKGDGNYVRVLFSGQPLITSTPLGVLDMIRYEDFEEYLDIVLPKDIVNLCSQIWTPLHQ